MLFGKAKIPLLEGSTPLVRASAMSDKLGINLYIKRDDLTPLGGGGNKLRKLEYLLFDAQQKGATTLLTMGGAQTNHGRLTAAVAARHGLNCCVVCIEDYPGEISANLLLSRLMGARVVLKKSDGRSEAEQLTELTAQVTHELTRAGEAVYEIPVGGSNVLGLLGYYDCAAELTQQADALALGNARVVTAVGSMGTYLGLFCGLRHMKSPLSLTGIAISPFTEQKQKLLLQYFSEANAQYSLGIKASPENFDIRTGYVRGGYNLPDENVRRAVLSMARTEAILLDPCYTGKAFAGLEDLLREGEIKRGETVIFLHTGGTPGLNTPHHRTLFERELLDGVSILGPDQHFRL